MEYQKIANVLESASDNLSKFRTRNSIEINDEKEIMQIMILYLKLQC